MSIIKRIVDFLFCADTEIDDMKQMTDKRYITKAKIPARVVVYLSQHIGAEAKCCVSAGKRVKEGQIIGKADGMVSANIHSPVSGIVESVEKRRTPAGNMSISVAIKSDGAEKVWKKMSDSDIKKLDGEAIINEIESCGIVGMGGATFPTHFKLRSAVKSKVKEYILNGAECEPYITADHRIMVEKNREIMEGTKILMKAAGLKHVCIGIEDNKKDAIKLFRDLTVGDEQVDVAELKSIYPQGAEKMLIKSVTGKEIPPGGLPNDAGVIVNNIGTVFAVYEAIYYGKPLIERVVTVTGDGVKNPKNILAKIGMPVRDLIDMCGGYDGDVSKIIVGGSMMGFSQPDDDEFVTKGMSCILVMKDDGNSEEERPCIRCGRCIDVCPMKLNPYLISAYSQNRRFGDAKEAGVLNCYECGKCAFVCPVRRPMTQYMKYAKAGIKREEAGENNGKKEAVKK